MLVSRYETVQNLRKICPTSKPGPGRVLKGGSLLIGLSCANWIRVMNTKFWLTTLTGVVLTAVLSPDVRAEKPVTRKGTSVMHYMTRNELKAPDGSGPVLGTVRLQSNEQGHSSKEMLDIRLTGLETNSAFRLIAVMGDDTNAFVVGEFSADSDGRAKLSFKSKGGKSPVPDSISPLTDLRALGIENAATQTVAHTWIADSGDFQYLVKRNLTPEDSDGTAVGSISLGANPDQVHFRLLAGGLVANDSYHLALNGESKLVVTADADGRIEIQTWPVDAPPVLELRSLAIWGASSNVVLRTSLPR